MQPLEENKILLKGLLTALSNSTPTPFEFMSNVNIAFDQVNVCDTPSGPYLMLGEMCNKKYMSEWRKGLGNILLKDLKKKDVSMYYEITFDGYKAMLRSLTEEEKEEYNNNAKLCNFVIDLGEVSFLLMKITKDGMGYSTRAVSIDYATNSENDEVEDNGELVISDDTDSDEDKEDEEELTSHSLFDD